MRVLVFYALLAVLLASPAFAQVRDAAEVQRSVMEAERKIIVAKNMPLSEQESEAFWPVYNEFQEAIRKLNERRMNLIIDLATGFEALSGERAQDMVKEALDIEEDRIKVQKKFLGKFSKVLPPKKVARFYQIENKLNARINHEIASRIPLIGSDVASPPRWR